uniref:SHSP domain-containing protein n=1 Tax=Davidia involucrata TaxID=16924 RepID=A0A5B6YJY7_DAVIN
MESQLVRRRMNTIAGHFATADDVSATAAHVFPMNCSSSLNSVIRRYDNRMYFARQGSSSQACFMRPVSTEQGSSAQPDVPLKYTGSANEGFSNAFEAPSFSRPARLEPNFPNFGVIQPLVQDCKLPAPEQPKFARPNRRISGQKQKQYLSKRKIHASESHGFEWSPRMDVAESGCNYVVTVELPGVSINDIRVEVNDQTLTVTGKRSTQWWKVESSNDSISAYHKREILQGPYQVVWPLPRNMNKDGVSAEFLDGFLRITIPKL